MINQLIGIICELFHFLVININQIKLSIFQTKG